MTLEKINFTRVAVILLFALTFTVIGWTAPVIHATYVPNDEVIQSHEFAAQDTTINSDTHYTCFDRTVYTETSGEVVTELYLVSGENRILVESESMSKYFQHGRDTTITEFSLPNDVSTGEYRYLLVIRMEMANGRVTRDFAYESDRFNITDGPATNSTTTTACQ